MDRGILPIVMLGAFLSVLDTTILNIALPYVMATFGSDVEHAKWITSGFFLAATVSMPLSGWLGNRFGYGLVFTVALGVFTFGAGLSAASWSMNTLILSRFVQGIGAGLIQPASIAILTHAYPPHMRGRIFGIWSIGMMMAPSLGPAVGGAIIEFIDWRAIFLLSAAVGVTAVLLAVAVIDKSRTEEAKPFDWTGYLALASCLVMGFLTITFGQQEGWGSGIIVAGLIGTGVSFLIFLVLEWDEPHPILPLRLFRVPDFALAAFVTIYRAIGMFGPIFLLPIFLFQIQGRESLAIGLMLMPGAVIMACISPLAGILTDRIGGRWPTVVGILFMTAGLYAYRDIDTLMGTWRLVYPQIFQGIGIALVMTPVITTGMNAVGRADAGHASWILNLCQRGGGAFAITLLGTFLHRQTAVQRDILGNAELMRSPSFGSLEIPPVSFFGLSSVDAGSAYIAGALHQVNQAATALAFKDLFTFAAILTATAVIPALFIGSKRHTAQ